jgi:hypothetical protein
VALQEQTPWLKPDEFGLLHSSLSQNAHRVEDRVSELVVALDVWKSLEPNEYELAQITKSVYATLNQLRILTDKINSANSVIRKEMESFTSERANSKRQEPTATTVATVAIDTAVPTYVPPPKTDVTPELINQSLTVQPQDTATVGSVSPDLRFGRITLLAQLNGIVASIIPINCSTFLPCDTIGTGASPNIKLGPKYTLNGPPQTVVADCMLIATNMYDPNVISYWIQNAQGEIFSLVSDNKIHDLDQMDTGAPIACSLRVSTDTSKRRITENHEYIVQKRRQVYAVPCHERCKDLGHKKFKSSHGVCGCLVDDEGLETRGIKEPTSFDATMTHEACQAMRCIENGGNPAMYNPFSMDCWCADPVYVDETPNGWAGRIRSVMSKIL